MIFAGAGSFAPPSYATGVEEKWLKAPEIEAPVVFNAGKYDRLTLKELRGKVVVLFFWSSSDSASEEAVVSLNKWYEIYRDKGLEIVGIHVPQWESEKSAAFVFERVRELKIKFPIALDNDFIVRIAYGLPAWPSVFIVDRRGYLRDEERGELDYRRLKTLLKEALQEGNYPSGRAKS